MTNPESPSSDAFATILARPERQAVVNRIERTARPLVGTVGSHVVIPDQPSLSRARRFVLKLPNLKEHARSLRHITRSRFQVATHDATLAAHDATLQFLSSENQTLAAENQVLRERVETLNVHVDDLKARVDELRARVADTQETAEGSFRRAAQEMVRLHGVMDAQRRSYVEMTRQLAQIPAQTQASAATPVDGNTAFSDPFLDIFYREFEDRYRGSREEILVRLREYVGHIAFLKEDSAQQRRIIDLGCGRGEWLEILREQGLEGIGVDTNNAQAEAARALGLHVEIDDAIAYLSRQSERSIDFISAFHLIEHLEFPVLVHLLKECLRVLKPEGRLLLETPNPQSLIVGAYKFWFDPTHVRPYPPELIGQVLESLGYRQIDVLPLHPDGRHFEYRELHGLAKPIADLLVGPLDYAVLCRRP